MTVTLDGSLGEWLPTERLFAPNMPAGYEVYGRFESGKFYVAIKANVPISTNTTLWFNTDDNQLTGHQIFGSGGGAEFNITFLSSSNAGIYTGGAGPSEGGTFVAPFSASSWELSGDGMTLELELPTSMTTGASTIVMLGDINNTTHLSQPYTDGGFRITDPGTQQFDGVLTTGEWTQRLDVGATQVGGHEIYGKFQNDSFNFAIKSNVVIGANTTFWLNTDGNDATGFNPTWTNAIGAEFKVEIGVDGVARLYEGADGPSGPVWVANIQHKIAPDGKSIEFAIPQSVVGQHVTSIKMKGDINNSVDLPSFFGSGGYTVTDPDAVSEPVTPADGYKIAIVYSETTAANFFSTMAYSQLFMAAQSQAMAAGIPFDIISESDLTTANLANLEGYDAIVFPSFRNVKAADVQEIGNVLTNLVYNHKIPLIAAGDFMTNNENNGSFSGDAYAWMKSLLGVHRIDGAGSPATVGELIAGDSEVTSGYADGSTIHTYNGNFWTSYFGAENTATAEIIATQEVTNVPVGQVGGIQNAVIGTVTGGHNVHFATEAFLADNNLLGKALDWVTSPDTGVQVSLHMSRAESIVASRTDMDQSQELDNVNAGIYDFMLPILQDLKAQYDFVGSYYVNIGYYPGEQETNWAEATTFYNALLAMGNEIGSHSYTHPSDTNKLLPNQLTLADLNRIKALYGNDEHGHSRFTPYSEREDANDAIVAQLSNMSLTEINNRLNTALNTADPTTITDPLNRALLEATFEFQFKTARDFLETKLGIDIAGGAVPGMPESLNSARAIIEYYQYLSGGASLLGAGYPGALGYLSPTDTGSVYIAPNMSFDFTLMGWLNLTAEQAAQKWLEEWASLNANSDMPIVVWPWHDYGITEWPDDGVASEYRLEMFTTFIQTAYNAGAEFVTLADLAKRISSFEGTSFSYVVSGNNISVTATPGANGSLGTFALDFDSLGGKKIQSVAGWYAYDEDSVFLDQNGGAHDVTLGTTVDDVTHITSIGSRAKLVVLSGDGTNLNFTINGEGKIEIDVRMISPASVYNVSGATVVSQQNGKLVLQLTGPGDHAISVQHAQNTAPQGADKAITAIEDQPYTFTTLDFGFTDVDGHTLLKVIIATLPATGALTLNGQAVSVGQEIPADQIGNLVWTPAPNENGVNRGSFTFKVVDNGGVEAGGQDTDPIANTITFNVTPVNDAPSGAGKVVAIMEDGSYQFSAADFPITDIEGNSLSAVVITTLPAEGVLKLNGTAITAGQSIPVGSLPQLVWTPATNATAPATFTFQVVDNGGSTNGGLNIDQTPDTFTINVTPVNDAPTGADKTVVVLEDNAYHFSATDFAISDVENNALSSVIITTVPLNGTLTVGGATVTAGMSIAVGVLGQLVWTPATNSTAPASFTFQVVDDGGILNGGKNTDASPKTFTISVTPVNDAPSGTDKTITGIFEDATYTLKAADFGFTDVDGNTLLSVTIVSIPTTGSLTFNDNPVTAGMSIAAADINKLKWTPAANANGPDVGSFTFQVVDNGGTAGGGQDTDAIPNKITFTATPINDAPSGTDKTIAVATGSQHAFAAADFGFSDVDLNGLSGVKITSLPNGGVLTLNGNSVSANDIISAASLGQLRWTPPAGTIGNGLAHFTFQVIDNGGTFGGGVNTDPIANTITFNVTPVNRAPTIDTVGGTAVSGATSTVSVAENSAGIVAIVASDPDDNDTLTYSIEGGADASKFTIDSSTGVLSLIDPANFEAPNDVGQNGVYDVVVKVTDAAGLFDTQAVAVAITNVDEAPVINAPGGVGGSPASISIAENTKVVATVSATDPDAGATRTFSLVGGADQSKFAINATTGALTLIAAPDYDNPTDVGGNRIFDVIVAVTDNGGNTATKAIALSILNVKGITYAGTAANNTKSGAGEEDSLSGAAGNDTLNGLAGNDTLNGSTGNDILNGGVGNDSLLGGTGNDLLIGAAGNDRLTGGANDDTFRFNTALSATTNLDTIVDFVAANDTIQLENAIFKKLTTLGTLNAAFFRVGTKAVDANDYIVYNKTTGALSYDADGSGAGAAIQFATLTNKAAMTAADFVVI